MNILSINFGHDASLALFRDGELIEFEELERRTRLKNHLGIKAEYLRDFLGRQGLVFHDIDIAALSGTQGWAMAHCESIQVDRGGSADHERLCATETAWFDQHTTYGSFLHPWYEVNHVKRLGLTRMSSSPTRHTFTPAFLQGPSPGRVELAGRVHLMSSLSHDESRRVKAAFLSPYRLIVDGVCKPAFYVNHHCCHAFYAYMYSAARDSVICTHDGALGWHPFHSGGVYLATDRQGVMPLVSHGMGLGRIYDAVAEAIGVDEPGKLMGLSAYANPSLQILELVPECLDLFKGPDAGRDQLQDIIGKILRISEAEELVRAAALARFRFDLADLNVAAQAAANVQYLVQQIFVTSIGSMVTTIRETRPDLHCLDLTGGFTLNCPANTALTQRCAPLHVNPLPGAGDTGLAIGAGAAVIDYLGGPVGRQIDREGTVAAFPSSRISHGPGPSASGSLELIEMDAGAIPQFIADKLEQGYVLCLHRGRSEVGPRALGRRSIVAHAVNDAVRDRINFAKGREAWRPLAPLCRVEEFNEYFEGDVSMGRFMLFTCRVLSDAIPAVTHVDGTARVQCVNASDEWLHPALGLLKARGLHPVVVNTSFNSAGEPLVETLQQAEMAFVRMGFDYLVTQVGVFQPRTGLNEAARPSTV